MRWFGPISSECTPVGAVNRTRGPVKNPLRVALMLIARITPLLTSPNTRSPLSPAPRPHEMQNAAPVIPIVLAKYVVGRWRGFGPLLFVFPGAAPLQLSFAPQPKFPPLTMRLISSLHCGPFSVSHRRPVFGSNVDPNELRCPNDQIRRYGFPTAAVPLRSSLRILPWRLLVRSCAFDAL